MSPRDTVDPTVRTDDRPSVPRRRCLGALGTLATGLAFGAGGAAGQAGPPERASSSRLHPASLFVRPAGTADQEPTAPAPSGDDLLVERRAGHPVDDGTDPDVVDGDLGQLTWDRFGAAEGHVRVKCLTEGTHVLVHLRNLVPKGLYTVWTVLFERPGFDAGTRVIGAPGESGALENVVGFGPLGPPDGSENAFRASASGEGQVSTIQPGGPLGVAGAVKHCALEEFEWHVIVGSTSTGGPTGGSSTIRKTPAPPWSRPPSSSGGASRCEPRNRRTRTGVVLRVASARPPKRNFRADLSGDEEVPPVDTGAHRRGPVSPGTTPNSSSG